MFIELSCKKQKKKNQIFNENNQKCLKNARRVLILSWNLGIPHIDAKFTIFSISSVIQITKSRDLLKIVSSVLWSRQDGLTETYDCDKMEEDKIN